MHPHIEGRMFVCEAGTLHNVEKTVPMSQIWIKRHSKFAGKALDNVIDLEDCPYDCGSTGNHMKIDLKDPEDMLSQISINEECSCPIGQSTVILHDTNDSTPVRTHKKLG